MKSKALSFILLLCALAGLAHGATISFGHANADHLSIKGAIAAASSGDVLKCYATYADTMTVGQSATTFAALTIDYNDKTATYSLASSSDHIFDADNVTALTIKNGTVIVNACGAFEIRGPGYQLVQDLTVIERGAMGQDIFSGTRSDTDSVRFENCTFTWQNSSGTAVRYPGTARGWFLNSYDIPVTFDNCTASGGKYLLRSTAAITGHLTISDCDLSNFYYNIFDIENGGVIQVDGTTFAADSVMVGPALLIETESSVVHNIDVTGCVFDDTQLWVGTSADVAQGGADDDDSTAVIQSNTFTGDNIITRCIVRTNYARVKSNSFPGGGGSNFGGTDGSPHFVILGMDGAYDTYDNTGAENILFEGNVIRPVGEIADSTSTLLPMVIKTGSAKVINNIYDFRSLTLPASVTRAKVFSLRSADSLLIAHNDFYFNDERWGVADLSSQTDDEPCVQILFANNRCYGTFGSAVSTTNWSGWNDYQLDEADFSANYYESGTAYIVTNDGVTPVSTVDAADSTGWFDALNFSDAEELSCRQNWAGNPAYADSSGVSKTSQNLAPIGVATSSRSIVEPIIGTGEAGIESPIQAGSFLRTLPAWVDGTAMEIPVRVRTSVERANLDLFLHTYHPVTGTTYAAAWKDSLRIPYTMN